MYYIIIKIPLQDVVKTDYNPGMLVNLQISNIVLIEKLNLEFGAGLNILTGETGAGKSILLDALSLALGARSDTGLVRHGCDMASVVAEFDDADDALRALLAENEIEYDGTVILRRTLSRDGKSRAWVNDTPISIKLLKQIGDCLVEIHGQFANHALLDATTHRGTLDSFARANVPGFIELENATRDAYLKLHTAQTRMNELQDLLSRSIAERDFLEHNVAELSALRPRIGEEEELSTQRSAMMNAEKNTAILNDAIEALNPRGASLDGQIFNVIHILERIRGDENPYQGQIEHLYEIAEQISEIIASLTPDNIDTDNLESVEERLFAIRAAARKHRCGADELPAKLDEMSAQLNAIDNSDAELKKITTLVRESQNAFNSTASKLGDARRMASELLRTKLLAELPDLKLGNADFMVEITDTTPSSHGIDNITFMIKTNPGTPFAPLHRSASGGELARLMLAMRVVLAATQNAITFVFDEVDTGISGATASAVGLRLNQLASASQALVITHSAQVAGFADTHFKISKHSDNNTTTTTVVRISDSERINEIARIISGAEITPESIATARTLIKA